MAGEKRFLGPVSRRDKPLINKDGIITVKPSFRRVYKILKTG